MLEGVSMGFPGLCPKYVHALSGLTYAQTICILNQITNRGDCLIPTVVELTSVDPRGRVF
jgi:hypothetical protein